MIEFLRKVEKDFKCKVIIIPHPKYKSSKKNFSFNPYFKEFIIDNSPLEIKTLYNVIDNELILKLSTESLKNVNDCRDYLDKKINNSDSPIYGINTGFGSLYNVSIKDNDLSKLQHNLILNF